MYASIPSEPRTYRFDGFCLDAHSGELRKDGVPVPLQDIPLRFLAALLAHPGELVEREALRQAIWPADVHLDFDGALATAARKARHALGDASHEPRYIETLPGRGFRFIGAVQAEPAGPVPVAEPGRPFLALPLAAALGAALAILVVLLAWARGWPPFGRPDPPAFQRLTFREEEIRSARFLPGGREVVVGVDGEEGRGRILRVGLTTLEQIDTGLEGHPLAVGPEGQWAIARSPVRTPRSVGTFIGTLAVGTLGDAVLRDLQPHVLSAELGPAGLLAVVSFAGGLHRLECPPGTVRLEDAEPITSPRVSQDGTALAFLMHGFSPGGRVFLLDTKTGGTRPLTRHFEFIRGLAWHGREVWFTAGVPTRTDLFAASLDGEVRLVHKGAGRMLLHDIDAEGRALISISEVRPQALVWTGGRAEPRILERKGHFWLSDLSRDGRQAVGWHMDAAARHHVILIDVEGGAPLDLGEGYPTSLSPDGRWVLVLVEPGPRLVALPLGIGRPWNIPTPRLGALGTTQSTRWMPDGKRILLSGNLPGRPPQLFLQDLDGGAFRPVTPEGFNLGHAIAPDGRRVVAESAAGLALAALDGEAPSLTAIRGLEAAERVAGWSRDGKRLILFRPWTPTLRLWELDPETGRRSPWKTLKHDLGPGSYIGSALVSPDGLHVAAQSYRNPGRLHLVTGLR
jgi:DNA-binding winged helix-turn-helix (wHTH) protein